MLLRMPKDLGEHPRLDDLQAYFTESLRELHAGVTVSEWPFDENLQRALRSILYTGHVVQGLESITDLLEREKHGIEAARLKAGQQASQPRLARLLLLSKDGSERFLRDAAMILERHSERTHGVVIAATAEELSSFAKKKSGVVKALLIKDRKALGAFLTALASNLQLRS